MPHAQLFCLLHASCELMARKSSLRVSARTRQRLNTLRGEDLTHDELLRLLLAVTEPSD